MTWLPTRRLGVVVVLAASTIARWTAAAPALTAEPAVGVVELAAGGTGTGSIVLRNPGTTAVVASGITAEPGCDAASVHASPLTGFTLAAGATQTIGLSCSPAPASMQRCNYLVRSPTGVALAELEAVCAYAGVSSLSPDATAIDFGSVPVGGVASRTVTLQNTGPAPVAELFFETTDLAGDFAVASPCNPDARECDARIPLVAAGASTRAVVTCAPRAATTQTAELHIVTSAGTQLATPISLRCTGVAAITPVLAVSPSAVDVGAVEVVASTIATTTTVHLSNTGGGTTTLRLLAAQLVDGGTGAASDWTVTPRGSCAAALPPSCALAPGQTVDIDLGFDPQSIGVRDATLLLNYHDTADRSLSVPLHGVGVGPTLDLAAAPTTLDFGTLPVGTAGTVTLAVADHGTRDLTDGMAVLSPAGAPFSINPGRGLLVSTAAPTPLAITCTPQAAGSFIADLELSAADVLGPPVTIHLRCSGDPAAVLFADPPAILLGEVRIATTAQVSPFAIASRGASIALASASLELPVVGLTVHGVPAMTRAMLDLTAAPQVEGRLDDRILVTPAGGAPLAVPVTGAAVAPGYAVPPAVALGTFCVQRPTTPRILALSSTGTATLGVSAPSLQSADSPFDLVLVAPLAYPNLLPPHQQATIAVTPRRRDAAGIVSDDVIWPTDIAGALMLRTTVTATFVADGGAIAPEALTFGETPVHVDTRNAQEVTLQNCGNAPFQLDAPQVPSPFSIDSPSFPAALNPGEIATFSVGFHPTKIGKVMGKTLAITSPQLPSALTVELFGEGVASGSDGDAGPTTTNEPTTSFYACSCTANDPSAAAAIAIAVLGVLVPRRRRPG